MLRERTSFELLATVEYTWPDVNDAEYALSPDAQDNSSTVSQWNSEISDNELLALDDTTDDSMGREQQEMYNALREWGFCGEMTQPPSGKMNSKLR